MGKRTGSSINGVGKLNSHMKSETEPLFAPYTKINLKCIKDLNIRSETIKLLEEHIGSKLLYTGLNNRFLDTTPKAQATKAKINKSSSNKNPYA